MSAKPHRDICAWLGARMRLENAQADEQAALGRAMTAPIPADDKLRPATSIDVVEGNILWYKDGDDGPFWAYIEEVLRPNDPWKAFVSHDGCRYGLDGAYVQIK